MTTSTFKANKIYQLKVTLKGSRPPIWRRILVADDVTLGKLHTILQIVMGWHECHLHQFYQGNTRYANRLEHDDLECFDDCFDENKIRLNAVLKREKQKFIYEYDFGDDWLHEIVLEKILSPEPKTRYPICIAGKRNGPPEDSGGIWGYEEMLNILKNPEDPQYADMREWIGGEFDPEEFDLEEINAAFRYMR